MNLPPSLEEMEELENVLVGILRRLSERYTNEKASDRVLRDMEYTANSIFRRTAGSSAEDFRVRIVARHENHAVDLVLLPQTPRGSKMLALLENNRTDDWVDAQEKE